MPVAALQCDVDDFGIGISEELARFEQAQFGLFGADGNAEMVAKEAAEVAQAATAHSGELFGDVLHQIRFGHFVDQLFESALGRGALGDRRLVPDDFLREYQGHQVDELAAIWKCIG